MTRPAPTRTRRRPRARLRSITFAAALLTMVGASGGSAVAAPVTSDAEAAGWAIGATSLGSAPLLPLTSTNVFGQDISRAPVDGRSAAMVANLDQQVTSRYGGVAAFNVWKYNASMYRVPSSYKRTTLTFDDCQGKGHTPGGLYGPGGAFENVPIPDDAVPAAGTDGQLTIYSPGVDRLWEFWKARKTSTGWAACWGGRLDHASQSAGVFPSGMGASASGLASSLGALGIDESKAGRIDHAIALSLPQIGYWKTWSYPAQRSDGWDKQSAAIPMGTRFRLDPAVDVGSLGLHPVAAAVAKAAQKYGFVVTDSSGAVSVAAESGRPTEVRTGADPWKRTLGKTPSYAVFEDFPWDRLQAVEKDWGKPR